MDGERTRLQEAVKRMAGDGFHDDDTAEVANLLFNQGFRAHSLHNTIGSLNPEKVRIYHSFYASGTHLTHSTLD